MALENGVFTAEQVRLPEHLEAARLTDAVPGMVMYVPDSAFIIDEQSNCFLNGAAYTMQAGEFQYDKKYIKVICLDQGLVVDHFANLVAPQKFRRASLGALAMRSPNQPDGSEVDTADLIPVVGILTSPAQILQLDAVFKEQFDKHYLPKKARKSIRAVLERAKAQQTQQDASQATPTTESSSLLE